jgi:hypothetical protein
MSLVSPLLLLLLLLLLLFPLLLLSSGPAGCGFGSWFLLQASMVSHMCCASYCRCSADGRTSRNRYLRAAAVQNDAYNTVVIERPGLRLKNIVT